MLLEKDTKDWYDYLEQQDIEQLIYLTFAGIICVVVASIFPWFITEYVLTTLAPLILDQRRNWFSKYMIETYAP